jgi:hypothetical protein
MEISRPSSPFLRLPTELRNQIYAYTLGGEVFDIYCSRSFTPFGFDTRILRKQENLLALLAVCHQLYAETRLLPFQLNAFRFKSEDAFHSWLNKFDSIQRESIQEIHLVTWKAKHMIEGEDAWKLKPLSVVLPVEKLPDLRRVEIEVECNKRVQECSKDGCQGPNDHGDEVDTEGERFGKWLVGCIEGVQVTFERIFVTDDLTHR